MSEDGPPISRDEMLAAASVGRLPVLARQLVLDGSWLSLEILLSHAADRTLPLADLCDTIDAIVEGAAIAWSKPSARPPPELAAIRQLAGAALARRAAAPALAEMDRRALRLAAALGQELGENRRAAELFERAGDDGRAAEAWGAIGDLERMEACLTREAERVGERRSLASLLRRFEALLALGERASALLLARALPEGDVAAAPALAQARQIEQRLCRGHAATLRLPDGRLVRVCGLPATLGRDGDAEIAVRDPGVSRRHARLDLDPTGTELMLEDLGSRGGTKLGGVALGAPLVLPARGAIDLGVACHLGVLRLAPLLWRMDGLAGFDRGLCVLVGAGPLPLALVDPAAADLAISFSRPSPRLIHGPEVVLRTAGRLVGASFDLAHGDVFQTESGFTLEIV